MDEAVKKFILSLFVDDEGNEKIIYPADLYPAILERYKSKGKTISLDEFLKMIEELVSEGLIEKIGEDRYKISEKGKSLLRIFSWEHVYSFPF